MAQWQERAEEIVRAMQPGGRELWAREQVRLMAKLLTEHNIPVADGGLRLKADASLNPQLKAALRP